MSRLDRKYIEELKELQKDNDGERAHVKADKVICDFLTELTYTEVVDEFNKLEKWYA